MEIFAAPSPFLTSLSVIGRPEEFLVLVLFVTHDSNIAAASRTVDFPEPFFPINTFNLWSSNILTLPAAL